MAGAEVVANSPGGYRASKTLDVLDEVPSEKHPRFRGVLGVFAPGPLEDRGTADRLGISLRRYNRDTPDGLELVLTGSGSQGNRWTVGLVDVRTITGATSAATTGGADTSVFVGAPGQASSRE